MGASFATRGLSWVENLSHALSETSPWRPLRSWFWLFFKKACHHWEVKTQVIGKHQLSPQCPVLESASVQGCNG